MIRRPPRSTLFPYTRSSDLMASASAVSRREMGKRVRRVSQAAIGMARKATKFVMAAAAANPRHSAAHKIFERARSEEHTSELQSQSNLVCRLLLEKNKRADMQERTRPETWLSRVAPGAPAVVSTGHMRVALAVFELGALGPFVSTRCGLTGVVADM